MTFCVLYVTMYVCVCMHACTHVCMVCMGVYVYTYPHACIYSNAIVAMYR